MQGLQMYNITGDYPLGTWENQFVSIKRQVQMVKIRRGDER